MASGDRMLPVLTPKEVGDRLRMSRHSVVQLMESGALKFVELGRQGHKFYRTSEHWLDLFLNDGPPAPTGGKS